MWRYIINAGQGGKPLGSIRLSNIADGIEDWELFAPFAPFGP